MPIHAFAGSLTRPMPQYGAANGKGIARLTLNDDSGQLVVNGITDGIDDSTWLLANGFPLTLTFWKQTFSIW